MEADSHQAQLIQQLLLEAGRIMKTGRQNSLRRTGLAMKLVPPSNRTLAGDMDARLSRAIARGRSWWRQLKNELGLTVKQLAAREGVTGSYIMRLARLAFLSPDIVEQTLAGDMPTGFTLDRILVAGVIPASWTDQAEAFTAAA